MYRIKISYQTGNTFHTEDAVDFIDMKWTDKEIVKKNLKAINDHYHMTNSTKFKYSKDDELKELTEKQRKEFWFPHQWIWINKKGNYKVEEKDAQKNPELCKRVMDKFHIEHRIYLLDNDGNKVLTNCWWNGHFETLYSIEIHTENDGTKYTF
jgi:hypothetical protein